MTAGRRFVKDWIAGLPIVPDASEADVLRELMQANNLTQARLAKSVKVAQSTLSAVRNGSRSLTKEQVIKLARFFSVSPAAFLQA